jgi:gliding motility-associated-like protein
LISTAQLSAPGMSAVRYTSYPSAPTVKDPVFIYCNASGSQKGTLNLTSPGGTPPFSYSWYKWNNISNNFIVIPGAITSSINNLDEGGYKVKISGGIDTNFVAWIFFDKPPLAVAGLQQQLCDRIALHGDSAASIHKFYYKDINNGSTVSLKNEITFLWSSDPSSFIPSPDYYINPIIVNVPPPFKVYRLPLEDVTYKLKVNSIGCTSESSFLYKSIHVKADFSVDPDKGEAPLDVTFTDKSVRGTKKYTWEFGDKTMDGKKPLSWIINKDSLWILGSPFTHTYYKPGEYSVKLTIESDLNCIDSMRFDKIVVDPSKLDIPNVFTPDGDGLNDNFIVESKSLRLLSVEVFSRSGMKVYAFYGEGEKLRDWQGWDGNVNNSSIKASTGVYFYIIRAYGWDNVDYNSKEQRGFVYLYR